MTHVGTEPHQRSVGDLLVMVVGADDELTAQVVHLAACFDHIAANAFAFVREDVDRSVLMKRTGDRKRREAREDELFSRRGAAQRIATRFAAARGDAFDGLPEVVAAFVANAR